MKSRFTAQARVLASAAGLFILVVFLVIQLSSRERDMACSETPSFAQTTDWLTRCLNPGASVQEVEALLKGWGRIGPDWGGVSLAHVLPGEGQELVIRYHPDSAVAQNTFWDPQGKLVVMQRAARQWRVVFDAPLTITLTQSRQAWDNWNYRILEASDMTGDDLDDLLVELKWSNGTHAFLRYLILLTAHPRRSELRRVFVDDATLTNPVYSLIELADRQALRSVIQVRQQDAITRTLTFNNDAFTLVKETLDPASCVISAATPDGSLWCGFDEFDGLGGVSWGKPLLGLYRVKEGQVSHFDLPGPTRALNTAPDGSLYVATGVTVLRHRMEQWETLLDLDSSDRPGFIRTFIPFDIAFAANGDVWVGGIHSLARFDGQTWVQYDIYARRILIAPDESLWADGWDGNATGDCCITHLTGSAWVTYSRSAALPVSEDLLKEIRALRNR